MPDSLHVSVDAHSRVTLRWRPSSTCDILGYSIERAAAASEWAPVFDSLIVPTERDTMLVVTDPTPITRNTYYRYQTCDVFGERECPLPEPVIAIPHREDMLAPALHTRIGRHH